jgi:hypothetical protein
MSLLHAIETCLTVTGIPASRFGRESVRDPRLVHDLRRGRQPGPLMEQRVQAYISTALMAVPEGEAKAKAMRRLAFLMPTMPKMAGRPGALPGFPVPGALAPPPCGEPRAPASGARN